MKKLLGLALIIAGIVVAASFSTALGILVLIVGLCSHGVMRQENSHRLL